jgi:O-methyltransferase domain
VPIGNEYHSSKFDDLNMLVLFRGRERTAEEFRRLLTTAGFTLSRILPTSSQWSVLEAVPVSRMPPGPRPTETGVASAPE